MPELEKIVRYPCTLINPPCKCRYVWHYSVPGGGIQSMRTTVKCIFDKYTNPMKTFVLLNNE